MALADFKSVDVAALPGQVGSIPTRFRQPFRRHAAEAIALREVPEHFLSDDSEGRGVSYARESALRVEVGFDRTRRSGHDPAGLSIVALTGCVSLSPEAKRVLVVDNPEHVKGCELVGRVRSSFGTHKWGNLSPSAAAKENEDGLKKDAHKLGADTVLVVTDAANRGEAYKCGRGKPASPPSN